MRIEKEKNQINYWSAIDDGLPTPLLVGIEHRDGFLTSITMVNRATGKTVVLRGIELEAIVDVFIESELKIERNIPEDQNIV